MFTLRTFTSILAFLSFSVQAFPLSLRDVVAPKITEPGPGSVWEIGTKERVAWDTSGFPSQVTNPIAQVILGFNESDSLNLDFDHPLAKGFKLTDGSVIITVPDVPPRSNYLIVLFGDSGDTSSIFAITQIPSPVSASASSDSISGATLPTASISNSSTVPTPTSTDITSTAVDTPTVLSSTGTTTDGSTGSSSSSSSTSTSNSASALAASSTSAGWSLHRGSNLWNSAAPFLMSVAPFIMVFMV